MGTNRCFIWESRLEGATERGFERLRRLIDLETAALRKGSTISLAPLYYGGCDRPSMRQPRSRVPGASRGQVKLSKIWERDMQPHGWTRDRFWPVPALC